MMEIVGPQKMNREILREHYTRDEIADALDATYQHVWDNREKPHNSKQQFEIAFVTMLMRPHEELVAEMKAKPPTEYATPELILAEVRRLAVMLAKSEK